MNDLITALLVAIGVVAGIGLLCGILLTLASKFMAVKSDERVGKIRDRLPGANCGACGFAGCDGYAVALVEADGTKTNLCIPGGDNVSKAISEILGVDFADVVEQVAFVECNGNCAATSKKVDYEGIKTCSAASLLYGGDGKCSYGCMGYGDCASICPTDSICIENGIAHVDPRTCIGCGMCVERCPKGIIALKPTVMPTYVACSNKDPGAIARKKCKNACIGCKKCEKTCPTDAIKVENNLSRIDYSKCIGCKKCAEVCPTGCIALCEFNGEA